MEKVKNCARGAALQTGTKLDISVFEDPGNDLLKNNYLVEEYEKNFKSLGQAMDKEPFLLGSTDIGNLSYFIPVIHPMVKTAEGDYSLHTEEFMEYGKTDFAYNGMIIGMKAVGMTGIRVLVDPEFLKNVKDEFEESTKGGLKYS